MSGSWKARLGLLLRAAAGLGLLYLAVRGLDWRRVGEALSAVDWLWAAAALASVALSLGLKALRWQFLLKSAAPDAGWFNLFGALLAGQAANIALPVRGGELSRAWLVSPAGASRAGILAAIGAEKVFDLAALTVLAAAMLPGVLLAAEDARGAALHPGWAGAGVALAAALGLWAAVVRGESLWRGARCWIETRALPRLPAWPALRIPLRWADEGLAGLRILGTPSVFLAAVGLTALIWANMLATNLLLFTAFRLGMPLLAGVSVLVLVHIGLLPSIMPGNIGPFYFFTGIALSPFGVPAPVALSYAIVLHALVVLPPLAGGGLFLLAARRRTAGHPAA